MAPAAPRLGFVGVGWIGGLRLSAVEAAGLAEVAALCDADPDRLRDLGGRFPSAFRHEETERLLDFAEAEALDGIVLATPNALHASQARAALGRGLPLFVQKPLGLSRAEVEGVLSEARGRSTPIQVDYSYRHLEGAGRMREMVRSGELGQIHLVEASFHNAYGPDKAWCFDVDLAGGGALLDLGVHLVDLLFWIFGASVPREVRGRVHERDGHPGIDHFAAAELTLDPDVHVRLTSSWHAHAGRDCDFRFTVYGSRGGAELRNRGGGFYDFELGVRRGRSETVTAVDSRAWMDRGILEWVRGLPARNGFDPAADASLAVAGAVEAIYRDARSRQGVGGTARTGPPAPHGTGSSAGPSAARS